MAIALDYLQQFIHTHIYIFKLYSANGTIYNVEQYK
jgi:hypothetical protein